MPRRIADTLIVMVNKKATKRAPKGAGRTPHVPVLVRMPPALAEALDRYIRDLRPAPVRTNVLITAVEDFLSAKGYWAQDAPAGTNGKD